MAGLDDIKSGKVSDGKKFMQDLKEKISTLIALERDPFYSKENIKRLESAINDAKFEKNMHYHELIDDLTQKDRLY